jgi:hypothetical protein
MRRYCGTSLLYSAFPGYSSEPLTLVDLRVWWAAGDSNPEPKD